MKKFLFFSLLLSTSLDVICTPLKFPSSQNANQIDLVDSILIKPSNLPALVGRSGNVLSLIEIWSKENVTLNNININLSGTTNLSDIEKLVVYSTGANPKFDSNGVIFSSTQQISKKLSLPGNLQLKKGANYLWITAAVISNARLTNKITADCDNLIFEGFGKKIPEKHAPINGNRLGIALRSHGEEGVDTYRIPGLTTTNKGTLIAVYDVRYENGVDLQGHIDVGMSRSTNGGKTWEPMKIIMDMGTFGGLPQDQNGIGDPAVLVDKITNTIWVAGLWAHGHPGKRNWTASKPGLDPIETSQFILVKSEDDGKTWSAPINITSQIKRPEWYLMLEGPGKGVTMKDGTLVFAGQFKDGDQMPHATIIYSKDHGATWKIGKGAKSNTTEAQVVELQDGSLMLNMRDNRGGSRSVLTTKDLGESWTEHPTSRSALIEPVCMGSLDWFNFKSKGSAAKQILLFSNPNSTKGRVNITLKLSFDGGNSWPEKYYTLLDAGRGSGYSCLTQINDHTVGILYESSQADLVFQQIDLREIVK
jgi:sialidase-1